MNSQDWFINSSSCTSTETVVIPGSDNHSLVVIDRHSNYELSNGNFDYSPIVKVIELDFEVKKVACGTGHLMVLSQDGSLYAKGFNANGQLGLGTTVNEHTFKKVPLDEEVIDVACGFYFSMILLKNGNLMMTGSLLRYQQHKFELVPKISDVTKVCCGYYFVTALTKKKKVYCWGSNSDNQLGQKDVNFDTDEPQHVDLPPIFDIGCGNNHAIAITTEGKLYGWGSNLLGSLSFISNVEKVSFEIPQMSHVDLCVADICSISCGGTFTIFVMKSGLCKIYGSNWRYLGRLFSATFPCLLSIDYVVCCSNFITIKTTKDEVFICSLEQDKKRTTSGQQVLKLIPLECPKELTVGKKQLLELTSTILHANQTDFMSPDLINYFLKTQIISK